MIRTLLSFGEFGLYAPWFLYRSTLYPLVNLSISAKNKRAMDATVAGLIGAAIGAVAGIAGTLITNYLQAKQEPCKMDTR